ncbi:MAG: hypothetical protein K2O34_15465, partial [Acetatifactor sp.]|nr:hypothetical protein [Acetatifactor sp.]
MVLQHRGSEEQGETEEGSGPMTQTAQEALGGGSSKEPGSAETGSPDGSAAAEENDPQEDMPQEMGSQVDVAQLLVSDRVQEQQRVTVGIDVSRYQGTIDWSQVAEAGIDFAMIRAGYRSAREDREIYADSNARYNMQEAQAAGIQ